MARKIGKRRTTSQKPKTLDEKWVGLVSQCAG